MIDRHERSAPSRPPAPARRRGTAGFSMVEVMVAGLILAIIALGMIPLYSRSIRSNAEGFDYTQVTNFAKSRAEEYSQYPFNGDRMRISGGSTELVVEDFYSLNEKNWVDDLAADDTALYVRTTTVRQFRTGDLNTPIDGSELGDVKEVTVEVEGTREAGSPLGPGKRIAVRVLKAI